MLIVAGGVLALPGSADISRPQSSSSRSSCEYQQSPVGPEFVSPDYRGDRGRPSELRYFRSGYVQQAGGYYSSPSHYQAGYNNTNGPTSGPGPAYRQNIQAGTDQGYSGYSTAYPGYPGYEGGGQEMSGYYQHQQPQPQPQPHNTNPANYSKSHYGQHYPGYYPGAGCQGVDNNTPLPPDFTYVGSGGGAGSEGNNQTQPGYQDFYAC